MGNGLASKLIYYWIFVLGGLSVSYFLKFATSGIDFIVMMIALSLVYWGMEFIKFKNKQRRGQQPEKATKRKSSPRNKR
jgi:mannose/fructose/N-acetylgalactosamine-specific phosphotransferase system component IIC